MVSDGDKAFVQLYKENIDVFRVISHSPTAVDILSIIIQNMDHKNNVLTTISSLVVATGKGKASVYRAITLLNDKEVIVSKNLGGAVLFICNANFAWTGTKSARWKHIVTQANVLVDESELPAKLVKSLGEIIVDESE
jgi:Fe2+ or Zn2+ uptake regulation protein